MGTLFGWIFYRRKEGWALEKSTVAALITFTVTIVGGELAISWFLWADGRRNIKDAISLASLVVISIVALVATTAIIIVRTQEKLSRLQAEKEKEAWRAQQETIVLDDAELIGICLELGKDGSLIKEFAPWEKLKDEIRKRHSPIVAENHWFRAMLLWWDLAGWLRVAVSVVHRNNPQSSDADKLRGIKRWLVLSGSEESLAKAMTNIAYQACFRDKDKGVD